MMTAIPKQIPSLIHALRNQENLGIHKKMKTLRI
jgi:hypothetical protein